MNLIGLRLDLLAVDESVRVEVTCPICKGDHTNPVTIQFKMRGELFELTVCDQCDTKVCPILQAVEKKRGE